MGSFEVVLDIKGGGVGGGGIEHTNIKLISFQAFWNIWHIYVVLVSYCPKHMNYLADLSVLKIQLICNILNIQLVRNLLNIQQVLNIWNI